MPSLSEVYEGAVNLLYGDRLVPGRSHFIALAVREIRDELYWLKTGEKRSRKLLYKEEIQRIAEVWTEHALPTVGPIADGSLPQLPYEEVSIPGEAFSVVVDLIKHHKETGLKPRALAKNLFVLLAPENHEFLSDKSPSIERWIDVTDYFVHLTHVGVKTDSDLISEEFVHMFESFENILSSLVKEFYGTTNELDEILEQANSRAN